MRSQTPQEVERLISAYLDGELTQADNQRVRLLLEDQPEYRAVYDEMRRLQTLTHSLHMPDPPDDRIAAIEGRISVAAPRRIGYFALSGGLCFWLVYLAVEFFRNLRMPSPTEAFAAMVVFGVVALFVSVAIQRYQELPHDRYRRIQK
jgi:anti-sigma factor RsiW